MIFNNDSLGKCPITRLLEFPEVHNLVTMLFLRLAVNEDVVEVADDKISNIRV